MANRYFDDNNFLLEILYKQSSPGQVPRDVLVGTPHHTTPHCKDTTCSVCFSCSWSFLKVSYFSIYCFICFDATHCWHWTLGGICRGPTSSLAPPWIPLNGRYVAFAYCGIVVLWYCGIVVLWYCGIVVLWYCVLCIVYSVYLCILH
jgi:hypothetical protein